MKNKKTTYVNLKLSINEFKFIDLILRNYGDNEKIMKQANELFDNTSEDIPTNEEIREEWKRIMEDICD